MLLFDPEYLTAANFRKRRLLRLDEEKAPGSSGRLHEAVAQELAFLDSILTSPLHRQSKSPTLWYHRYWLISTMAARSLEAHAAQSSAGGGWVSREIAAVLKAGERHPHNYYAWQYLRRLHALLCSPPRSVEAADEFDVQTVTGTVLRWCLQHPSDVSGWSFLHYLLDAAPTDGTKEQTMAEVEKFAKSLQWKGEGLHVLLKHLRQTSRGT